jgi:hypothetical protein
MILAVFLFTPFLLDSLIFLIWSSFSLISVFVDYFFNVFPSLLILSPFFTRTFPSLYCTYFIYSFLSCFSISQSWSSFKCLSLLHPPGRKCTSSRTLSLPSLLYYIYDKSQNWSIEFFLVNHNWVWYTFFLLLISSSFFLFKFSCIILRTNVTLLLQITEEFEEIPVQSRGFGILDVGYRSTVKDNVVLLEKSCIIMNMTKYI